MLVVAVIGFTDVVFATDSIPAIFGVTADPFIIYSSNIFAVLGLRALFFALSNMMAKFHLLKFGLALILSFSGTKMLIADMYKLRFAASIGINHPLKISIGAALAVVAGLFVLSVIGSAVFPRKAESDASGPS
jgi:predicted tellurium resistance membrane protein TerC